VFKPKAMVGFTLDDQHMTLNVIDDDGNTTVVTKIVPATALCATNDNHLLLVQRSRNSETQKLLL